jgi:hypothetical protein
MVAFQGCELESEDYDTINPAMFPKTAADAEALVAEFYYLFNAGGYGGGVFELGLGLLLKEYSSDIGVTGNYPEYRKTILFAQWTAAGQVSEADRFWAFNKSLSAITLNIDRISAIDMDETRKKQLTAELRCGRGLMAFLLYDIFGPVPLPDLETLKNPLDEKILPRATEEEMQKFIEDDLWAAINAPELPDVYKKGDDGYGRFSRGIAYFVLLKHYMQASKWDKAEAAGRELLKKEKYGYDLMPEYKDIFTLANEKNEETIFSSISKKGFEAHEHGWYSAVLPLNYPAPDGLASAKYNMFKLAWWFVNRFDPDDPRGKEPILIKEYTGTEGKLHNEANDKGDNDPIKWGAIPLKYHEITLATGATTDIDYIIYRYADALTLLAEAIVRNGNAVTQEAIELLNRVRTRALPAKPYTQANAGNPTAFYTAVLQERAFELYWEGCRRQDLVRHGEYVSAMENKAQRVGNQSTMVTANHARFPLPQSVINEGKGAIKQNPGY